MINYPQKCFCGEEFLMQEYGDGTCPKCGQKYEYEEGIFPILDAHQEAVLKAFNEQWAFEREAGVEFKLDVEFMHEVMERMFEEYQAPDKYSDE